MSEQNPFGMLGVVFQPGGGLNEPYCVEVAQKLRARHNVVINGGKVAELIQPHTHRVICRSKTLDWNDDHFASWDEAKVRAFVRRLHNESPAGACLHLGNEQGVGFAELRNTDIGMDECEKLGRLAVIHNRAVKSYGDDPRVLDIYKPNFERAYAQGHLWGDHATYFDRHWRTSHLFDFRYLRDDLMAGRFPEVVFTEGGCCFGYQPHRGYRWGPMPLSDEQHGDECVQTAWALQDDGASVCLFLVSDDRRDNEWVDFIIRSPMITYMQQRPVAWKKREEQPVDIVYTDGYVVSVPQTYVNVRREPSTSADIVDQLTAGARVNYADKFAEANGYRWQMLDIGWVTVWNLMRDTAMAVLAPYTVPALEFGMPMDWDYLITGYFKEPRDYGPHEGVDFVPYWGVHQGAIDVLSVAEGVVEATRNYEQSQAQGKLTTGYGNYIRVRYDDRGTVYRVWYCHLFHVFAKVGAPVFRGQVIGTIGSTGSSTAEHLHITVQQEGAGETLAGLTNVIDPATVLSELA